MKRIFIVLLVGALWISSSAPFTVELRDAPQHSLGQIYRDYLLAEFYLARQLPQKSQELLQKLSTRPLSSQAQKHIEHALVLVLRKGVK